MKKINQIRLKNGKTHLLHKLLKHCIVALVIPTLVCTNPVSATIRIGHFNLTHILYTEQPSTITGQIVDSKGQAIPNAGIKIENTSKAVISDINGHFTIQAQIGDVLIVSSIGFNSLKVRVAGLTPLTITLSDQQTELSSVVVTALGIKRAAKAITYNVQEVPAVEIMRVQDANFMNTLNGKIAGVNINNSSSGIGGGVRVVMRGTKSISGNNNALFVVDGIPLPSLQTEQASGIYSGLGMSGDGISLLNPDDFASVSVLTGAAAAALYGSDAANGVVQITTKKGSSAGTSVNVGNNTTFLSPFVLPKFQNTYRSVGNSFLSWGEKLSTASSYDPKDFLLTGYNVTNTLSISTGTDRNQTYFSFSNVGARGIIPNNTLDRYNLSFRNSSSLLDNKLTLDLSMMYMKNDEQNMISQGQYANPLAPVYLFPPGQDFEKFKVFERFNVSRNFKTQYWPYGNMGLTLQNPYWVAYRNLFNNSRDRYIINTAANYKVLPWFNASLRVKYDASTGLRERRYYASTDGNLAGSPNGEYHRTDLKNKQLYADLMLNVDKRWRDISLTATLGASIQDIRYDDGLFRGTLSIPNIFTYNNINRSTSLPLQTGYHDQTQALFATASMGLKDRIYLDVTGRNDWVSALAGTQTKSIFYPSVGLSTILTEFLPKRSDFLNFLKARLSYSEVGNAPMRYVTNVTYPIVDGFPTSLSYLPNTNLEPERTKSYELGINSIFFKNKFKLDFTLYKSSTFNQLFNPTLPASSGYTSFYVNGGRVDNKGLELSTSYDIKLGDFNWTSGLIWSLNRNNIVQLLPPVVAPGGETISLEEMNLGGTDSYRNILKTGGTLNDIYVNTLKTDEHGYIVVDLISQAVTPEPNKFIYAGTSNPKYNLGWRNSIGWKGLNLNALVNARVGGIGISMTQAIMDGFGVSKASAVARDEGGALVNGKRIPASSYYQTVGGGGSNAIGAMYAYSATNVRLAEVSLSYDVPLTRYLPWIKKANISVIGRNLFMLYNKAPFDPETTASTGTFYQGIDYFMQPSMRSIGFSVKLGL